MVRNFSFTPRWLSLTAAAFYSHIGETKLKQLAEDGEIIGFRDPTDRRGTWIFDRESLDAYRMDQSGQLEQDSAYADLRERL